MSTPPERAAVDWVLSTTRAVRRRLDRTRPVPRDVLVECLELAAQAPNAGASQRLHWVVVSDAEQRLRLAEVYRRADGGAFARIVADARARGDERTARTYADADWFTGVLHEVPVLVVPCIESDEPLEGLSPAMAAARWASAVPAVWSFQLALRARGLGSVLTTVHLRRAEEAAEVLGLPDRFRQVALIPVAYTVGTEFRPARRTPVEEMVSWDRVGGAGD